LAAFSSASPDEAISTSIKQTESVLHVLPIDRKTLDLALGLDSMPLHERAKKLETDLINGLKRNEYVTQLAAVVNRVGTEAFAIVQEHIRLTKPAEGPGSGTPGTTGDESQLPRGGSGETPPLGGGEVRPIVDGIAKWAGSDEADVRAKFGNDLAALERNRKLVGKLKALYRASQVEGDALPEWLPDDLVELILEVHHIQLLSEGGEDERSNMIVLTPTLHALVHACEDASIDLESGVLSIPSRGIRRKIEVKANHNG
jgi:hypothetical protein